MSSREHYTPGAAAGAEVRKDGDKWTLVLVRELAHPPDKVWKALTEPEHLRAWAPFDSDRSLGTAGVTAQLTTVGAPSPHVTETQVKRADASKVLEFNWGGQDIRWELEALGNGGTRLTILHNIDRRFISMGAAGWHICIDVMDRALAGHPVGRTVGPDAMKFEGWQRLNAEYAKQFGVELPQLVQPELTMARSKGMLVGFWVVTALFCLQMGFTAYAELRLPQVAAAFTHLGFPAYFRVELSWAKVLGIVLLLAPVPSRLKEWAYAGFAIDLASAVLAHLAVGDGPQAWGWAAGTGVLWGLSYFFWRRLEGERP